MIAKILTHPGLLARAPPRSPARRFDLFQAAFYSNADWIEPASMGRLVFRSCERADQRFLANARAKLFREVSRLE